MANVNYRVKEFTPSTDQKANGMVHSFTAQVVTNGTISNAEMAKKIEARTGFKSYEALGILSAFAEVAAEELLEGNAVVLGNTEDQVLTLRPNVSGSVSDEVIKKETTAAHAKDSSVAIRTTAVESDLTPARLSWNISATVGIKFSKNFAQNKSAKKVKVGYTEVVEDTTTEDSGNNRTEV